MSGKGDIVCFGELLLRLNAQGHERLLQTNTFNVHVGGAEVNVAATLAQFGAPTQLVSVAPKNVLGDAAIRVLRGYGVSTKNCLRHEGRMGLYFMSTGAVLRRSEILYDRSYSAFAQSPPDAVDWQSVLGGASWLHVSGITPAISKTSAQATIAAVEAASNCGVKISFDGNYRSALWEAWAGDGREFLNAILAHTTLAFIDHRDVALVLSKSFDGSAREIRHAARKAAFDAYPKLSYIASTTRSQTSANDHSLTARIATREATYHSRSANMPSVVDRIGGGDAFAAGVLYTLWQEGDLQRAVDFGLAASLLKHSIPGDMLIANVADVEEQMREDCLDVRR